MYVCSRLFISHGEFRYEKKKIEIIEPLLLENNHIFARNLSKSLFCLLVSHIFHFAPRLNVNNLGKNYQKCLEKIITCIVIHTSADSEMQQ